jgi:hypothetical protein
MQFDFVAGLFGLVGFIMGWFLFRRRRSPPHIAVGGPWRSVSEGPRDPALPSGSSTPRD